MRFETHTITELLSERPGLQRVRLSDGSRAYALTQVTGPVALGDEVVVNTTAVDLGLGTGGWHVVHWNLHRRDLRTDGGGHIMKMRYTSLQADTGAAEEHLPVPFGDDIPHLGGVPVVVAGLHSQMGVVAATIADARPGTRVSYVMTDGAALPLALSDLVHDLRGRGLLTGTVTAGHAFGGDLEAVGVPSAVHLAVERQAAEVVVVAMGPGVVGTGHVLGTTALEVAGILDVVEALGGVPLVAVRASGADARERHRGLSHHTLTALRLSRVAAVVPLPVGADADPVAAAVPPPHVTERVDVGDVVARLDARGLTITSMGRTPAEDPLFVRCAAAAAVDAVARLSQRDTVADA